MAVMLDIDSFIAYLGSEKRRSPATISAYRADLEGFESYFKGLDSCLEWEGVDGDVVRSWMEWMLDKGNSARSVGRRLSALRSMYRFALSRGLVGSDPTRLVDAPKKPKPLPCFVGEGAMDTLLDDVLWGDSYEDVLAKAIVTVFYGTGIRLSELVGLECAAVDMKSQQLKVRGKRDKDRIVPFGRDVESALSLYSEQRSRLPGGTESAFFLWKDGKPLSAQRVRREISKRLGLVSSQRKRTPHVLRHSFATSMLNNGASLEVVRKLLGHASLSTTEVYTHVSFEQMSKEYENAHPRVKS